MWSNGLSQTLELEFPDESGTVFRVFGLGIRRIVAHASGDWSLQLRSGERVRVRLRHGWIAASGRAIGLRWVSADRRRFACGICCVDPRRAGWRRLLVRLRVPMPGRLS